MGGNTTFFLFPTTLLKESASWKGLKDLSTNATEVVLQQTQSHGPTVQALLEIFQINPFWFQH